MIINLYTKMFTVDPMYLFVAQKRNRVQKRAAKFANNINESGWESLAQRRLMARICVLFKAYTGGRAWKAIGDRLLKPCYLSRDDQFRKIMSRK